MAWPSSRFKDAAAGGSWTPTDMNGVQDMFIRPSGIIASDLGDVGQTAFMAPGVGVETALAVTPGTLLALNVAAGRVWIPSTAALLAQHIRPSTGTVTVTAAHGTNPRIDQVVATYNGGGAPTVTVVAGTATAGAHIGVPTAANYRAGAATLAADQVRLYDVLVPALFTGPFVQATHLRDRRPWARGEMTYDFTNIASLLIYSDLAGRADGGYEYVLNAVHTQGGAATNLSLQVNGDTTAASYETDMIYQDNGGGVLTTNTNATAGHVLGWAVDSSNAGYAARGLLYAPPATHMKVLTGEFYMRTTAPNRRQGRIGSRWTNATDDISTLTLIAGGSSMAGTFTVRKMNKRLGL